MCTVYINITTKRFLKVIFDFLENLHILELAVKLIVKVVADYNKAIYNCLVWSNLCNNSTINDRYNS